MKKIKIFKSFTINDLEDEVNNWLEAEGDKINIIETKYNVNHNGVGTQIMIIVYETKEVPNDKNFYDVLELVNRYYVAGKGVVGEPKIQMRSVYWCKLLDMIGVKDEQTL